MEITIAMLQLLDEIRRRRHAQVSDIAAQFQFPVDRTQTLVGELISRGFVSTGGNCHVELTYAGLLELTHLRYHALRHTLAWYVATKDRLRENLDSLVQAGTRSVAFYGSGDVAEVGYALLSDGVRLDLVAVLDDFRGGENFYRHVIRPSSDLPRINCDRIVVASFKSAPDIRRNALHLGIAEPALFFLH